MRAGLLRHRVSVLTGVTTPGADGSPVTVWFTQATAWASIRAITRDTPSFGELQEPATHEIRLRYQDGITTAHRVSLGATVYVLINVGDPFGDRRQLRAAARLADDLGLAIDGAGRTVIYQRPGQPPQDVTLRALVRGYGAAGLVGAITQDEAEITVSAAALAAIADGPRKGDRIQMDGRYRAVQAVEPIYQGEVLIGYRLRAKG